MNTPESIVQRQLDAYNAKDIAAWLATYAPDAEQFELHGARLAAGHEQMRARIAARFAEPDLYAQLLSRVVMGPVVVDHERITRNFAQGKGSVEMLCVYEVAGGVIVKASFALGAQQLDGPRSPHGFATEVPAQASYGQSRQRTCTVAQARDLRAGRMQIGFFHPAHLESTVDLFHEMSAHYNPGAGSSREVVKTHLVNNILGAHSDVRLVLACEGERVVGLAAVALLYPAPQERGQLFMKDLYVVASHRSSGVGEALMRWLARHALAMGCVRLDWTVEAANERGLAFYRGLGAAHVSEKLYFRFAGSELARFAGDA